jgi:hypothetical protein
LTLRGWTWYWSRNKYTRNGRKSSKQATTYWKRPST